MIEIVLDARYSMQVAGGADRTEEEILTAREEKRLARFPRILPNSAATLECRVDPHRITHFTVWPEDLAEEAQPGAADTG